MYILPYHITQISSTTHKYIILHQYRPGWGKIAAGTAAGWLIGAKFHCSRKEKKLNARHKEEQKALYTQYYNDVYTLQQQNTELAQALEQLGVRVH